MILVAIEALSDYVLVGRYAERMARELGDKHTLAFTLHASGRQKPQAGVLLDTRGPIMTMASASSLPVGPVLATAARTDTSAARRQENASRPQTTRRTRASKLRDHVE